MTDFNTPPTKDEIQYARDVIQGKRKWDARIIIGFAIFGALFGILVGFSSAQANNESLDICLLYTSYIVDIYKAMQYIVGIM